MTSRPWSRAQLAVIERSALVARLDHDDRARQPADDPVAQGKVMRQRRRPWRELAHDSACSGDFGPRARARPGNRCQHRSRRPRPSVRGRRARRGGPHRRPPRKAAHDRDTAAARSYPSRSATSRPYGDAARDPTIATARAGSSAGEPATHSTGGGSTSVLSRGGKRGSSNPIAVIPEAAPLASSSSLRGRKAPADSRASTQVEQAIEHVWGRLGHTFGERRQRARLLDWRGTGERERDEIAQGHDDSLRRQARTAHEAGAPPPEGAEPDLALRL